MLEKIKNWVLGNASPSKIWLLYFLLAAVYFYPLILGRVFYASFDRIVIGLPSHIFALRALKSGQFPLWNPNWLCGYNYCGSGQFHLFNPLVLILYLFPEKFFMHLLSLQIYIEFALIGIFTYLFVFRLTKIRLGALLAGIICMFSQSTTTLLTTADMGNLHVIFLFPLLLYSSLILCEEGGNLAWVLVSAITALMFLGGVLYLCVFSLLITIAFYTWHSCFFETKSGSRKLYAITRRLAVFISAIGVGLLISSMRLLPFLAAVKASTRSNMTSQAEIMEWIKNTASPVLSTLRLLMPEFFYSTRNGYFFLKPGGLGQHLSAYETFPHYIGLAGLFLSTLGIWRLNRKNLIWILMVFFMALFALNTPLSYFLLRYIMRGEQILMCRFSLLVPACLAVMAAYGVRWLIESERFAIRMFLLIFTPLTAGISLAAYLLYPYHTYSQIWGKNISNQALSISYLLAVMFSLCMIFLARHSRKISQHRFLALFFIIFIFDLLLVANKNFSHIGKIMSYDPLYLQEKIPPDLGYLKNTEPRPAYEYRVYSSDRKWLGTDARCGAGMNNIWGFLDVTGPEAFCYRRYGEFTSYPDKPYFRGITELDLTLRLITLFGINYDLDKTIKYGSVPARIRFYYKYKVLKQDQILYTLFHKDFNPYDTLLLEEPPESNKELSAEKNNDSRARFLSYKFNSVEIEAETKTDGILLLSDRNEEGWRARIDGKATKIYFADYIWRAVMVPAGKHIIKFNYFPPKLGLGIVLSILGTGMLLTVMGKNFFYHKA